MNYPKSSWSKLIESHFVLLTDGLTTRIFLPAPIEE